MLWLSADVNNGAVITLQMSLELLAVRIFLRVHFIIAFNAWWKFQSFDALTCTDITCNIPLLYDFFYPLMLTVRKVVDDADVQLKG